MSKLKNIVLIMTLLLLSFTTVYAGVSFNVGLGSNDYYQPVGDYDYLPYAYQTNQGYASPTINFHDVMGQYGVWVSVAPFGQVWRPYASNDWRPYTYGHWISNQQYGQMWEGYEPWAWAGYHYGNWVYERNYRWVWIPGYDWHPGRVSWARSYDSIGWMPSPPNGYDYSRGYLSNVGPNNQFEYNDNDFGAEFGNGNYGYGGPYYDNRYRNMYYNPSYNNININLWVFINNANYGYDNYANYSLGQDYTRYVFDRRLVRITNRQIDRVVLERIVKQKIRETPVEVRELRTDKRAIKVVVPTGNDDVNRIRKNSKEVVRDIIAPGFAENKKSFKGQNSKNKEVITRIFNQEKVNPKVETLSSEQIINQARESKQNREQNRVKRGQAEKVKLEKIEKEGKLQEPKKGNTIGTTDIQSAHPENGSKLQKQDKVQKQIDTTKQKHNDAAKQQQIDAANKKHNDAAKQQQIDASKKKQSDATRQQEIDAAKQRQKDDLRQQQIDAAKQKPSDDSKQRQNDMKKQKQHDDVVLEKDKTDLAQDSNLKKDNKEQPDKNTVQKSKDKKSAAKSKEKDKPKDKDQVQGPDNE